MKFFYWCEQEIARELAERNPVAPNGVMFLQNQASESVEMSSSVPLLARVHLKLGAWRWHLNSSLDEESIRGILTDFQRATQCASTWAKAWHKWALFNTAVMSHYMSQKLNANAGRHVVLAITGYFRSIAHGSASKDGDGSLQVSSLHFAEMKVLTSMMKMSVLVCRYDKEPMCSGLKLLQHKVPTGKLLHQSSLLDANCWFPLSVKDFT
jgi:hypothetical protein